MPFDVADHAPVVHAFARGAELSAAFEAAARPDAAWAAANPDRALAFLFVCPQPCEALDELLAA